MAQCGCFGSMVASPRQPGHPCARPPRCAARGATALRNRGPTAYPEPPSGVSIPSQSSGTMTPPAGHHHFHRKDRMIPRIIVVAPSDDVGEIAREMAPAGFELIVARNDGPELAAALGDAQYMVCYPNVPMREAFYRAAPRLRLVQLLSAGYDNV